ncbi:MAG: glucoamylase family protein [Bacteroidota bacterium]
MSKTFPVVLSILAASFGLAAGIGCDTAPGVEEEAPLEVSYASEAPETVDPFLDTLQTRTFQWFWDVTDHETGLTPDRWPRRTFSSIAAIGFALTSYGVGAENGYVARSQATERTLNTLRTLWTVPQGPSQVGQAGFKGFFYHFLTYEDATRYRDNELSTIDTALLMAGVLFAREYYDAENEGEAAIRAYADSLFQRVEWDWFVARPPRLAMAWHPERGFGQADWQGYNEAMLLYLMALGSPTFAVDPSAWEAWTSTYAWNDFYGYEHVDFSPLFGHQYSHVWIDYRGIQDAYMRERGIDYFENSQRATLSQKAYADDNPMGWTRYGGDLWGLTASDGPADVTLPFNGEERRFHTYWARGASTHHVNDDGTLVPTAAGGSIPFAPDETIAALKAMRAQFGEALFTEYGFLDAVNPSFTFTDVELRHGQVVDGVGWVDGDYLGIDQGPILLMAENYRSGFVWDVMKRSPYLVRGLQRAGFTGGWLADVEVRDVKRVIDQRQADPAEQFAERDLVVLIGSSTAAGAGASVPDSAWANRYRSHGQANNANFDLVNLARGGYTTYHMLPTDAIAVADRPAPDTLRNITAALRYKPDAIIINLPSNDRASGFANAEQLANFETMVQAATDAGVPVWVFTTQPRNLDPEGQRDQRRVRDAILDRFGDRAIDVWRGLERSDDGLDPAYDSGDGIHLNDAGHRLLFERVRAAGVAQAIQQ